MLVRVLRRLVRRSAFALCVCAALAARAEESLPATLLDKLATVDGDQDGLEDEQEKALLERYSPIVLIAEDDPSRPASVQWIRSRTRFAGEATGTVVAALRPFSDAVRAGSRDHADWTMYGHVYPRRDGGTNVQYWFYFPWNDGPLFFDHESDWEHVTVELDAKGELSAVSYAQHHDCAPGVRVPWAQVPREGTHPVVLSAWGSHASYAFARQAPFWETVRDCPRARDGSVAPGRCRLQEWRVGSGGSRVVNLGERGRPLAGDDAAFVMRFPYGWGSGFSGGAPAGPPFQRGFCVEAAPGRCGAR